MDTNAKSIAESCLRGAEANTMTFPEIVGILTHARFDGYMIDFRNRSAVYYPANSDAIALTIHAPAAKLGATFDAPAVRSAILDAQSGTPGYTYKGFCEKVVAAGCAGYLVSLPGRRVLYFGRDGEIHVEHFP